MLSIDVLLNASSPIIFNYELFEINTFLSFEHPEKQCFPIDFTFNGIQI